MELTLAFEVEETAAELDDDATEEVLEPAGEVELPAGLVDEPPAPLLTVVPPLLPPTQLVELPAITVIGARARAQLDKFIKESVMPLETHKSTGGYPGYHESRGRCRNL